jgi:hypothetical protein
MIDIEHPEITHARKTGYATYEEFKHDGMKDNEEEDEEDDI